MSELLWSQTQRQAVPATHSTSLKLLEVKVVTAWHSPSDVAPRKQRGKRGSPTLGTEAHLSSSLCEGAEQNTLLNNMHSGNPRQETLKFMLASDSQPGSC